LRPEEGGQQDSGILFADPLPAGSFPDEQSPWGLLDGAGGHQEWTESIYTQIGLGGIELVERIIDGNSFPIWVPEDDPDYIFFNKGDINHFSIRRASSDRSGIRLATVIPNPAILTFACVYALTTIPRKRNLST